MIFCQFCKFQLAKCHILTFLLGIVKYYAHIELLKIRKLPNFSEKQYFYE